MNSMEVKEFIEQIEEARREKEQKIGLTIAIAAALVALATMMSHRSHTHEVVIQAQEVDDWGYYQAKHGRAHDYGREAELALELGQPNMAAKDYQKSIEEQCGEYPSRVPNCVSPVINPNLEGPPNNAILGAEKKGSLEKVAVEQNPFHEKPENEGKQGAVQLAQQARARHNNVRAIERQARIFDIAELFLEFSIVCCSISLLTVIRIYWKISMVIMAVGGVFLLYGSVMPYLSVRLLHHMPWFLSPY